MKNMRMIRGVRNLVKYLNEIGAPMSESTIYRLIKQNKIPYQRPAPAILIFNLDKIDKWISGEE